MHDWFLNNIKRQRIDCPVVVAGPQARGFLGTGNSAATGYDLICEATCRDSHARMLPHAIYYCFFLSVGVVLSDAENASEPQKGCSGSARCTLYS